MITKGGSSEPLFLVIGYWILAIGDWLLVIGYWILAIGYWLLVIGYELEVREVFPEGCGVQGLDNLA